MKNVTIKELQLAAKLLEMAGDEFSNHGCNDLPEDIFSGWTHAEVIQIHKEAHEFLGDEEPFDPKSPGYIDDATLMRLMAEKLNNA